VRCGAQLKLQPPLQEPPPAQPSYAPSPAYPAPPYASPAESPYQGVAIRFVAILIDTIIIAIISGVLAFPFRTPFISITNVTGTPSITSAPNPLAWVGGVISLLVFFLYFILLEGAYGQTVGKMAVKIKVVREDGTKIDYADSTVRNVLRIIDLIPFVVPYLLGAILIWSSDRKQRLGDRAGHTVVVKA